MSMQKKKTPASAKKTTTVSLFHKGCTTAGLPPRPGKSALEGRYRDGVSANLPHNFTDSVALDQHYRKLEPNDPVWDYGIGLRGPTQGSAVGEMAFWIEPHPASSTGEVDAMLQKLAWLKNKLRQPEFAALSALTEAAKQQGHTPFRWLAQTGSIRILAGSKEARRLALAGLDQPRRLVELP